MHGRGVYLFANGQRHEGTFRGGFPDGAGVATWPDGRRYEGAFRDGQPNGRGVLTWPDGTRATWAGSGTESSTGGAS